MNQPLVPLRHLDELWFQITGTHCNLACRHCFISCHPHNREFGYLSRETIERHLRDSVPLGVKEYYFTGGEPFLHPEIVPILETTLTYGPVSVLTNGTMFHGDDLAGLRRAEDASLYSLELRISLDGFTAEANDAVRGHGTFDRILKGVRQALDHGFLPILTIALTEDAVDVETLFAGFVALLKEQGCDRPRVKILPTLRLGAEVSRCRGYHPEERVTAEMLEGYDVDQLLCSHSRIVTDRGVAVCPILIEAADAHLGQSLVEAVRPFAVRHSACFTCYQHGALCANASSRGRDA